MDVINFNPTSTTPVIVQPTFLVYSYKSPEIIYVNKNTFRIVVGCQSITVTRDNISQIRNELNGVPSGTRTFKAIVKQKSKPKAGSPELMEKSKSFYISKSKRCYSTKTYTTAQCTVPVPNKFFIKKPDGRIAVPGGYYIREDAIKPSLEVLNIIENYFKSHE